MFVNIINELVVFY